MGKDLFLDTSGTCFLCSQGSLSQFENGVSAISLQSVCRYLKISSSSILRTVSYKNFSTEESQSKKEECQFSVTMCSTCSSLTSKLTELINQLEMINNSIAYQLQIFHQTISASHPDAPSTYLHGKPLKRMKESGSSSEVETSLVETLRHGIISKCSIKVKDAIDRTLPKVDLERPKSESEEKAGKTVDSIETSIAPPSTIDVSSLLSSSPSPLLEDPLSLSPEPEMDPLSDQAILPPPDSRALQLEAISNKLLVSDTCKKYSKMSLNKVHCSLCSYSNATCDAEKFVRIHLLNVHPEILFTSERLLHTDTKVTFNDRCRKLLSVEVSRAKQRGGSTSNGKPFYQCGFCDRKFICNSGIKPHLLTEHLKMIKPKLSPGNPETFTSLKGHHRPKILRKIRTPTDKTGDKAEIFIVPDEIVKEIIRTDEKRINSQPIHEGKSFVCSKEDGGCGKVFPQRWRLTDHKKRRCKNLSERGKWTCEFSQGGCGKGFANKHNLSQHQKLHCLKRITKRQDDKSQTSENFKVAFGIEYSVKDVVIYK